LRSFKVTGKKDEFILQQHKRGDFDAEYKNFNIVFHNLPFVVKSLQIDNVDVPIDKSFINTQSISINKEFTELHLIAE